jgi:predicted 3-demethylubiquinone-9 3-methyltransferase (glyoxalase superfamily)
MAVVTPFLMFQGGKAEAAMELYTSLFPDSEIIDAAYYDDEGPGPVGTIVRATFRLGDQQVICIDSPIKHEFAFTPSFSFFVDCDSAAQLDMLMAELSADGEVLMEAADYGFSQRFGWVADRFGVTWQFNVG